MNKKRHMVCILLILTICIAIYPIFLIALKSIIYNHKLSITNYILLFSDGGIYFFLYLRSLLITTIISIGQTVISIIVGFCLGKLKFKLKPLILFLYILVLFLPYSATLLPNYIIIREFNLLNTQLSLILPALFSPLGVIIMTIFTFVVPSETIEAVLLDTTKYYEILLHVIVPQTLPGILLTFLVSFSEAWNMVEQPNAMMEDQLLHPLSVSLNNIYSSNINNFANTFLFIIPPIILVIIFLNSIHKYIFENQEKLKQILLNGGKAIAIMFLVIILSLTVSVLIYNYTTPKVYVTYSTQGTIDGNYYGCIIPRQCVCEQDIVYIVSQKNTPMGTRYYVTATKISILAENGSSCAISLNSQTKLMLVLAYDGEIKEYGDVILYMS